jgi:hypothetical protein
MWPFKKKQPLTWILEIKKVRRTVHLNNGQEPIVTYAIESYTRLPDWKPAEDYHYTSRVREWDDNSTDTSLRINNDGVCIAINRACIHKIVYEVVNE